MFNDKLPVNLIPETNQFDLGGAIIGAAIGGLLTGGWGALLGASLAGNSQKYTFNIVWNDDSKTSLTYTDKTQFLAQMLIWNWRIDNKLFEDDLVTFGFRFSNLKKEKIKITGQMIAHNSGLNKITDLTEQEKQETLKKLSDFLVMEINRYLSQHTSIKMTVGNMPNGDLTFTTQLESYIFLSIVAAFIMFVFYSCSQSDKQSEKYSFNLIEQNQELIDSRKPCWVSYLNPTLYDERS